MSVLKETEGRFYPVKGNPKIARYISLTKFISMLAKSSLFFSRISKLEDPYEGTYPKRTNDEVFIEMTDLLNQGQFGPAVTENTIKEGIEKRNLFDSKLREITCVNCWHKFERENYLLWKSYSGTDDGIMILSRYEKLYFQLEQKVEKFTISRIDYHNYENVYLGNYNTNIAFINKPHFYSDEEEIRAIHEVSHIKWEHNWSEEECANGVYFNVDLDQLIDEIRIAPFAPKWYFDLVCSLNKQYDLNKLVRYSELKK